MCRYYKNMFYEKFIFIYGDLYLFIKIYIYNVHKR